MDETLIPVSQAIDLFVYLFDNITEKKYQCSGTKIKKLLAIVAIDYFIKNKESILFGEKIVYQGNCGAWLDVPNLPIQYYISNYPSTKSPIQLSEKDKDHLLHNPWVNNSKILASIKSVFVNFGAESADDIGAMIADILSHDDTSESLKPGTIIELRQIADTISKSSVKDSDNELFNYLRTEFKS